MRSPLTDYNPELEVFQGEQPETLRQFENEVLSETEEMELASELLDVGNERQFDRFLGDLVDKIGKGAGSALHSPAARSIGDILKGVVTSAIPGGVVDAGLGNTLASMAEKTFGLELEGLSHEDREFEAARRYVRFAGNAIGRTARMPRGSNPTKAARQAAAQAARRYAPGLARRYAQGQAQSGAQGSAPFPQLVVNGPHQRGQWYRNGRNVIIVNCQPPDPAQTPQPSDATQSASPDESQFPPPPDAAQTPQQQPEEETMHDIDRTQLEAEMENFEYENFEYESEGVFNELQEMELASELMEVQNEQELEQFLGDLIKKAGSAIGKAVKSPIGQAIMGGLKTVAKTAIPLAAKAAGTYFGGPMGGQIAGNLGSMLTDKLGLEMEAEDREFEGAKQFVRVAAETVRNAVEAPAGSDPRRTAQTAVTKAVRNIVPQLLQTPPRSPSADGRPTSIATGAAQPSSLGQLGSPDPQGHHHRHPRSGRWVRQHGHKIVLLGV
jgi:hypothetical protein